MKKIVCVLLSAVLLVGMLAGCGKGASNSATAEKKTHLTVLASDKTTNLDPIANGVTDIVALQSIYDCLVRFDDDGNIVPNLAKDWTADADGVVYTFNLRDDVKFQDGSPFSADDVIFTLDSMKANPAYAGMTSFVTAWEKTGDYSLKITSAGCYVPILNYLASQVMIVPQESYNADTFPTKPIGCGPYKLVSIGTDGSVELEAFDGYFGGAPAMKTVSIKAPLDATAAIMALKSGEVDMITNINSDQYAQISGNTSFTVGKFTGWQCCTALLMGDRFNDDPNLRAAITYAMNRENALSLGASGLGTVATELFPKRIMGDFSGCAPIPGYDLEKAKEYVAKAKDSTTPIVLSVTPDQAMVAQSVQADLKAIGITVNIEQLDMNSLYTKLFNGELGFTINPFGTMQMTVSTYVPMFASNAPYIGNALKKDADYDALAAKLLSTTNKSEQETICKQALQMLAEKNVFIPLFTADNLLAYSNTITGVSATSAGTQVFYLDQIKSAS